MLARSFQVNSYGMGFGIADILDRVCCRITPNSLSGGSSSLFSPAGWLTKPKFGIAEDIYHAGGTRMRMLFFSRIEAVLADGHLIGLQRNLVILRRRSN